MSFKDRILYESDLNVYTGNNSIRKGISHNIRNHWDKYGLGALGATALIAGNEDFHKVVSDWRDLDKDDLLWNHFMDKAKEGIEHIKFDTHD
jgi:hypothetical protein